MIPRSDMASKSWFFTQVVVLVFAAFCMIHHVQCANYTVGAGFTDTDAGTGNYTWTNTVNGLVKPDVLEEHYQQWANSVNVTVGDVLIFYSVRGEHTVFLAKTELAYADCDFSAGSLEEIPDLFPATYTVKPTDGTLFFTCTIAGHCAGGQKVKIKPSGTTSAPTPAAGTPSAAHQSKTFSIVMQLLSVCCFTLFTLNHLYL